MLFGQIRTVHDLIDHPLANAHAAQAILHHHILNIGASYKVCDDAGTAYQCAVFLKNERIRVFKRLFGGATYSGRAPILLFNEITNILKIYL